MGQVIKCPHCKTKFIYGGKTSVDTQTKKLRKNDPDINKKLIDEGKICCICGQPLDIFWTVIHGQGYCKVCGAPHELYKYDDFGRPYMESFCSIKPQHRVAYRGIYLENKENLKKYNYNPKSAIMTHGKKDNIRKAIIREKTERIEKMGGKKDLSLMDILKILESIERRDLENVNERIEILGDQGVLVYREYADKKDPVYYTFDTLREHYKAMV